MWLHCSTNGRLIGGGEVAFEPLDRMPLKKFALSASLDMEAYLAFPKLLKRKRPAYCQSVSQRTLPVETWTSIARSSKSLASLETKSGIRMLTETWIGMHDTPASINARKYHKLERDRSNTMPSAISHLDVRGRPQTNCQCQMLPE